MPLTQLSYSGDIARGLATAQEVVELNRFLARKDAEISMPNLAESLAFLGDRLYDNGPNEGGV